MLLAARWPFFQLRWWAFRALGGICFFPVFLFGDSLMFLTQRICDFLGKIGLHGLAGERQVGLPPDIGFGQIH